MTRSTNGSKANRNSSATVYGCGSSDVCVYVTWRGSLCLSMRFEQLIAHTIASSLPSLKVLHRVFKATMPPPPRPRRWRVAGYAWLCPPLDTTTFIIISWAPKRVVVLPAWDHNLQQIPNRKFHEQSAVLQLSSYSTLPSKWWWWDEIKGWGLTGAAKAAVF